MHWHVRSRKFDWLILKSSIICKSRTKWGELIASFRSALSHLGYFLKKKKKKPTKCVSECAKQRLAKSRPLIFPLKTSEASFDEERARWNCFAWMNLNHINSLGKNDWHVLTGVAPNIAHSPIGQLSWSHRWNFRPLNFTPYRYGEHFKRV